MGDPPENIYNYNNEQITMNNNNRFQLWEEVPVPLVENIPGQAWMFPYQIPQTLINEPWWDEQINFE